MEIVKQLPAYLLAFVFVVFGLNHFLNFIPMQSMPGDAGTYADLLVKTGYMTVVKLCEIVFGAMLIFPKTRALGFILIAPVVVNILLFEVSIAKQPGIGVVLLALNVIGLYLNKSKYESILQ